MLSVIGAVNGYGARKNLIPSDKLYYFPSYALKLNENLTQCRKQQFYLYCTINYKSLNNI